ncbi:hypothetical protein [Campylobacter fetus]|uniref:hypothetical protein n=1 Tax=Campylobacter fetus TaxID=196 RepID=UPI0003E36A92|nr:hypothetical protein [Campylobacter fetus]CDF65961.1 hypothetical protein CSG_c600 [Campylobacter fetus subsp. venerealis str. 84-112]
MNRETIELLLQVFFGISIGLVALAIAFAFLKRSLMPLLVGAVGFGMSFGGFFFMHDSVPVAKTAFLINLSLATLALIYILIGAALSKQGYECELDISETLTVTLSINRNNALLYLSFIALAATKILACVVLMIDVANILTGFFNYFFIGLLIASILSWFIKNKRVSDFINKIAGAFIVSFMLLALFNLLGINRGFKYFYSPIHKEIYASDRTTFRVPTAERAKFISEKLKAGETDMKKLLDEYIDFQERTEK